MTRFETCFSQTAKKKLAIYFTAGFPELDDTVSIAKMVQDAGADIIEIGMPFSDPLADGPVIQASSGVALDNGMKLTVLFEQLKELRKSVTIPVVLMGYINPVLRFGRTRFLNACQEVGVDGLILPDVPLNEFEKEWKSLMDERGLTMTFLVTPETTDERVKRIDSLSSGFLYLVSSSSTTGGATDVQLSIDHYTQRITSLSLKNPLMVGFGISNADNFQSATKYTDGAIVGSAFIKELTKNGVNRMAITDFIKGIKG
jgi:tryptophan synthase alpha chain